MDFRSSVDGLDSDQTSLRQQDGGNSLDSAISLAGPQATCSRSSSMASSIDVDGTKKKGKGFKNRVLEFQKLISDGVQSIGHGRGGRSDCNGDRRGRLPDLSSSSLACSVKDQPMKPDIYGTLPNPASKGRLSGNQSALASAFPQGYSSLRRPAPTGSSGFTTPTAHISGRIGSQERNVLSRPRSELVAETEPFVYNQNSSSALNESLSSPLNAKDSGMSMLSIDSMESAQHHHKHDRTVDEYMDAKSGSDDSSVGSTFVDTEGVKVRKIKLISSQNVGFESLPVQFVNKATKSGFVFNILVIGETGVGKSTLINSLFNYDFKLPPGDCLQDSVTLDKHTFNLEEGSVRLQLTVIETKGYGDQLNMADSCQGIVEYIDKQYEAYFQEESQVVRRLSDYKDTRIHVCLFCIAPTGSTVRALDLECMKLLGNKVNIIPVIARGDSLTKKELEGFKRRIMDELRLHKISIYKFPEDDGQVAEQNRRMNADMPFAVVGSSDVHEVAGHKARARVYPWGIVDIENASHCDFTSFREALLRVNMDHLMQTTNLQHYEVYRDRRMTELGYSENENQSFMETINRLRQGNEQKYRQKEEETRTSFVNKVREKESELKERERELHSQFEQRRADANDHMQEVEVQRTALLKEIEIFNRVKSELINQPVGTIKPKKK